MELFLLLTVPLQLDAAFWVFVPVSFPFYMCRVPYVAGEAGQGGRAVEDMREGAVGKEGAGIRQGKGRG